MRPTLFAGDYMLVRVLSALTKSAVESSGSVGGATTRKISALSGTVFALAMFSSSGAMAQCALPAVVLGTGFDQLAAFGSTTASNLIATVNTINTAFLTQTTAFISAPPNPPPNSPGGGVWVRGVGGKLTTTSNASLNLAALGVPVGTGNCFNSTETTFGGVQAGSDYARLNFNGWNLHLGTTVGYGESTNTTGSNRIVAHAPFAGVYAAATKGGFYIDGQVLGNYYEFGISDASVGVNNQHSNARGISIAGSIGYNFQLKDNWFVEPSAGVIWSRTEIDPVSAAPTVVAVVVPSTVSVNDVTTTLGHAGVRVGKTIVSGNLVLQPFVAASVWHEFASDATATGTTNFAALGIGGGEFTLNQSSTRVGTYGQYAIGLAGAILNTGWVGYIRGDYRNGEEIDGWSVNGGIRYQFTPEMVAAITGKHPIYKAPAAPVAPPYNWTGIYVGAYGGITYGTADWDYLPAGPAVSPSPKFDGAVAGGQIGYNYQFANRWVLGVEVDGGWSNAIGSKACPNANFFVCEVHLKWLASATGRLGYSFWNERILTYLKGGVAAGGVTVQTVFNLGGGIPPSGTPTNGTTSTATGWTIGFGTEVGLTKNWSAKGEYMYYDLGSKNYTVDNGLVVNVHPKGGLTRVGINYRFGAH